MVAEGRDPVLVEWAARTATLVMPPLKVFDEVTDSRAAWVRYPTRNYRRRPRPGPYPPRERMIELGRFGKAHGQGFYDWKNAPSGRVFQSWRQADLKRPASITFVTDLCWQAAEMGRVLNDGLIKHHQDAEVGAILGLALTRKWRTALLDGRTRAALGVKAVVGPCAWRAI